MNTTREVVAPAMRAASDDICGPDADRIFTSDTRDLMAFFSILRKLLQEVRCSLISDLSRKSCIEANVYSAESTTSLFKTCTSQHTAASSRSSHT